MAVERTPDAVTSESFGSVRLVIATFAELDDGDTWVTNIPNAVGYWCNATTSPTQTDEAIDVSFSAGTFTFNCGEEDKAGMLYVLTKS